MLVLYIWTLKGVAHPKECGDRFSDFDAQVLLLVVVFILMKLLKLKLKYVVLNVLRSFVRVFCMNVQKSCKMFLRDSDPERQIWRLR